MSNEVASHKNIEVKLQRPFEADDIKWRVQRAGISSNGHPYVMTIPYVSNRAIQKRLDEALGVFGWENAYKPTPDGKGYLCGITIHLENKTVTKWDGAEYTSIEPLKGALSDSMKRTAVQLGIGRYLYLLEIAFTECMIVGTRKEAVNLHVHYPDKNNKSIQTLISWANPSLPAWALPFDDYQPFIEKIKSAQDMTALKNAFTEAYRASESSKNNEFQNVAIAAKDARKREILASIDDINAAKLGEIDNWLENEMETFSQLPSEATVNNYRRIITENLSNRISECEFDCSSLTNKLDKRYEERINELSKGNTDAK